MYKRKRSYSGFKPYKKPNRQPTGFFSGVGQIVKPLIPYAVDYLTNRNRVTSGVGVTSQYDAKRIYRKKTMPRYKKRRWVKYVKKVRAALMKDVGSKTIVLNNEVRSDWTNTGNQIYAVSLYGAKGLSPSLIQAGHNDLEKIFLNDPQLNDFTAKAVFMSAVLDITLLNMSQKIGTEDERNLGLEVDVYELVYSRKIDATNPRGIFTTADTETSLINPGQASLDLFTRGATPFDFPHALSKGVKILSKKKYFLGKGETATYQLRIPKNYTLNNAGVLDSDNNFAVPYVTRTLLIVAKGLPGADGFVDKILHCGTTRKYMYKVIKDNIDQDNALN